MTGLALILVFTAALAHATWNLLAKKAGGGVVFVWLCAATSTVLWAPLILLILVRTWNRLGRMDWVFLVGSGLIHVGYFLVLQRAYSAGDFSLVYPLARGTGPVLSTVAGIALLGERPTTLALFGVGFITIGIFAFSSSGLGTRTTVRRKVFALSLLTGVFIAFYTVWDKHAVAARGIPPLLMEGVTSITRVIALLPLILNKWRQVPEDWLKKRQYAIWIGALNPLAYLLILFAMTFTAVSYIAPTREISILFGALFGAQFLKERDRGRRLTAAALMVLGVICLAVG